MCREVASNNLGEELLTFECKSSQQMSLNKSLNECHIKCKSMNFISTGLHCYNRQLILYQIVKNLLQFLSFNICRWFCRSTCISQSHYLLALLDSTHESVTSFLYYISENCNTFFCLTRKKLHMVLEAILWMVSQVNKSCDICHNFTTPSIFDTNQHRCIHKKKTDH